MEKDTLNVVFFGGSITYNPGWRNDLEEYFTAQFPEKVICYHNKGIPSLGSVAHVFRYDSDVLSQVKPDILFYESVVNDRANAYPDEEQARAVESIIRRSIAVNPNMDIIMMYFADPDKLADYKKGRIPDEICLQNNIADHYGIPVIDISREVYERIQAGEFSWEKDIKDLHPSPFGQKIYLSSMKVMLDSLLLKGKYAATRKLPSSLNEKYYRHARYESVKNGKGTFKYEPRYIPDNGQPTRAGFTDVPMLVGEKPEEEFVYEFEGTTIGICYISGNDAGIIRYRIDGGKYQVKDLYTKYSDKLHVPKYVILKDDLNEGKHKIEVEIMKEKNEKSKGNACRIVHFLVN
ncbi:SGNH/GDSL hydrolase family protein [Phocaeicola coprocola]|uniref:SGNH/GDSL hydrolase family protein n=1 Tax=Phocaeicola coprocola TaxID=310298 RepID=UPI0026715CE9